MTVLMRHVAPSRQELRRYQEIQYIQVLTAHAVVILLLLRENVALSSYLIDMADPQDVIQSYAQPDAKVLVEEIFDVTILTVEERNFFHNNCIPESVYPPVAKSDNRHNVCYT